MLDQEMLMIDHQHSTLGKCSAHNKYAHLALVLLDPNWDLQYIYAATFHALFSARFHQWPNVTGWQAFAAATKCH